MRPESEDLGRALRRVRKSEALARQKYWQIITNFTTPLLYNHILKLHFNDYK
jgi:hypothetical protein